jgi:NAD(P)-dependent dehydrogenase (short-subunit alcohol dehydrogenase family)
LSWPGAERRSSPARRKSELDTLVAEIKKDDLEATAVVADINVETSVSDLIATAVRIYGRLDIAFNNAGTEGQFTPFVDQTNEIYNTIFNANVRGVFWSMKYEAKTMLLKAAARLSTMLRWAGLSAFPMPRFTSPASMLCLA